MAASTTRRDCQCVRARHEHGTHRAYQADKCRCLPCRLAHSAAGREYRNGGRWVESWVDATGTRRRLRALAAAGVTSRQIAEQSGLSADMVIYLRGERRWVTPAHAAAVRAAYDALWDKATNDPDSRRCATQARTRGYLPPMAYDDDTIDCAESTTVLHADTSPAGRRAIPCYIDEIAVERAMLGDRVKLTKAERSEAVRTMTDVRGMSAAEIAVRLATTKRTVVRDRSAAA